jgi:hypothetical protein
MTGSNPPQFRSGKTQYNTSGAQGDNAYAFLNLMKNCQEWSYSGGQPTDPTAPPFPIIELDADGYITSSTVPGTAGCYTVTPMPTTSEYAGQWILYWDGNGTLSLSVTASNTSGSLTSTTGSGFYIFNRTDGNPVGTVTISITAVDATNHVRNVRLCKYNNGNPDNKTRLDRGEIFDPDHIALMRYMRGGVIRSIGWVGGNYNGTNESGIALWAHRKSRTYVSYASPYRNPAWYGGRTTHNGSDYTLAYPGFALINKVGLIVVFDVTSPQPAQVNLNYSTTAGQPIQIIWTAHGLVVGNTVTFGDVQYSTTTPPPAPLARAQTYYINTVIDANTFTVSATSGGAVINATSTGTGSYSGQSIPRININSTGFVPITGRNVPYPSNVPLLQWDQTEAPNATQLCWLIYDATFGYFFVKTNGPHTGVPPEVFIDYCAAIGAHPHMVAPYLSIEPVSDFMTSWVTYVKNTYPWMKPRIEPPNEVWNGAAAFFGTPYANSLSYVLWGTADVNQAYGKWCSTLGQAVSAIYGNDRTRYSMLCSVWTTVPFYSSSAPGASVDARLKSTNYVNNNGGSPAYLWVDRVCGANYFCPAERYTCQELIDAYNWSVTYSGNAAQQSVLAEGYVGTSSGSNTSVTVEYVTQCFSNIKAWAQGMPGGNTIAGVTCYEGGYSPDYLGGGWTTNITGASQAASCVLTLATTSANSEHSGMTGNPAVVGMQVTISGVVGMTQLNGNTYTINAVSGNLVTINVNSTGFTAYSSGGQVAYVNSQTYSNNLRKAGKFTAALGVKNTLMYSNLAALAGSGFVSEYPSNFILTGINNVWSVLDPDIYASRTPQFQSIVAWNSGG